VAGPCVDVSNSDATVLSRRCMLGGGRMDEQEPWREDRGVQGVQATKPSSMAFLLKLV